MNNEDGLREPNGRMHPEVEEDIEAAMPATQYSIGRLTGKFEGLLGQSRLLIQGTSTSKEFSLRRDPDPEYEPDRRFLLGEWPNGAEDPDGTRTLYSFYGIDGGIGSRRVILGSIRPQKRSQVLANTLIVQSKLMSLRSHLV